MTRRGGRARRGRRPARRGRGRPGRTVVAERAGERDDVGAPWSAWRRCPSAAACRWRRSRAGRGRSRCGRRARSAATCRHIRWVCGKPCSSTTGGREPPTAAFSATPSATVTSRYSKPLIVVMAAAACAAARSAIDQRLRCSAAWSSSACWGRWWPGTRGEPDRAQGPAAPGGAGAADRRPRPGRAGRAPGRRPVGRAAGRRRRRGAHVRRRPAPRARAGPPARATPARLLVTEGAGLRAARRTPDAVDAWRVRARRSAARRRRCPPSGGSTRLRRGAGAGGAAPPTPSSHDEDWARARARPARRSCACSRSERRAEARLRLGRAAEAVPDLDAHVAAHPWREDGLAAAALALYRSGGRATRWPCCARAHGLLAEQLGVEPGPGRCAASSTTSCTARSRAPRASDAVWAAGRGGLRPRRSGRARGAAGVDRRACLRSLAVTGGGGLEAARDAPARGDRRRGGARRPAADRPGDRRLRRPRDLDALRRPRAGGERSSPPRAARSPPSCHDAARARCWPRSRSSRAATANARGRGARGRTPRPRSRRPRAARVRPQRPCSCSRSSARPRAAPRRDRRGTGRARHAARPAVVRGPRPPDPPAGPRRARRLRRGRRARRGRRPAGRAPRTPAGQRLHHPLSRDAGRDGRPPIAPPPSSCPGRACPVWSAGSFPLRSSP